MEEQNEDLRKLVFQYQHLLKLVGVTVQHPSQILRPINPLASTEKPPPDPIPGPDWVSFGELWVLTGPGLEGIRLDEPPSFPPPSDVTPPPEYDGDEVMGDGVNDSNTVQDPNMWASNGQ